MFSHSSVVDDSIEEHKLLNQHSEKAHLRELAGESEDAIGESEDLQSLEQLRETVKTERGQKVM